MGVKKLDTGISAKRQQIEQTFVLKGIGMLWLGFRLAELPTPSSSLTPQTPKLASAKTLPSNYGQTVAGGTTL